ncbi:hypothetical protein F511_19640 [Dorcoceras hygrometricum]|uniref:Uncharacterized protein n=1 Tax=Dorcoceras hygrometricum TaxID=472368 RepID=A0A2Z7C8L5_9LAMI|nr:hypothetical protein F511_19640 [Dorcoceras hygrometricum]
MKLIFFILKIATECTVTWVENQLKGKDSKVLKQATLISRRWYELVARDTGTSRKRNQSQANQSQEKPVARETSHKRNQSQANKSQANQWQEKQVSSKLVARETSPRIKVTCLNEGHNVQMIAVKELSLDSIKLCLGEILPGPSDHCYKAEKEKESDCSNSNQPLEKKG